MANVKLTKKDLLEKLQAKLTILKGTKLSQQEILDKCIEFSDEHLEDFINEKVIRKTLTPEKMKLILANPIDCPLYFLDKSDDDLLYSK